jgi:hypothetical protein
MSGISKREVKNGEVIPHVGVEVNTFSTFLTVGMLQALAVLLLKKQPPGIHYTGWGLAGPTSVCTQ